METRSQIYHDAPRKPNTQHLDSVIVDSSDTNLPQITDPSIFVVGLDEPKIAWPSLQHVNDSVWRENNEYPALGNWAAACQIS